MRSFFTIASICLAALCLTAGAARSTEMGEVVTSVRNEVSGQRARDYTARLWRYEKWYRLPTMRQAAREARDIMTECRFDNALIVETPADGVTQYGTWTNPVGWDITQATLEVIEPPDLPDEYRRLCNYLDNPTSIIGWSAPTPPGGIEAELVMLDEPSREGLERIDARGKIVLVSRNASGLKRCLDEFGVAGLVSDQIESQSRDFIDANCWINAWSDKPGGWMLNAGDSKNNLGFAISQKKGNYLRELLRSGRRVVVRAVIDSRYYTDSSLPYVVGAINGTGEQEVVVVSHMYEWGANDDCAGCAAVMEGMRAVKALIESGKLPRPKRTIRCWMGHELYGSMAFAVHNLDRLRSRTVAVLCCDSPASDYDLATTAMNLANSFNACPSFTDAVLAGIARVYYTIHAPRRLWRARPFMTGLDNFFCEPMIGVPTNAVYMDNANLLHHNSMDTIDRVDPRSLAELATIVASYLYYLADAGEDELPVIARLTFNQGISVITDKAAEMEGRLLKAAGDGAALGKALHDGSGAIDYYTGLQIKALESIERLLAAGEKPKTRKLLSSYQKAEKYFGDRQRRLLDELATEAAAERSLKIVKYRKEQGPWEKNAATIVPERKYIGTLTLDGVPVEQWQEISRAPMWWRADNWAAASYWWCDGKRNLNDIKELMELEAGTEIDNFDLIKYYRFLQKFGMVEFVE